MPRKQRRRSIRGIAHMLAAAKDDHRSREKIWQGFFCFYEEHQNDRRGLHQLLCDSIFVQEFFLNGQTIKEWGELSLKSLVLNPEKANRFFLTAITQPVEEWSTVFASGLTHVFSLVYGEQGSNDNIRETHGYTAGLSVQITALLQEYEWKKRLAEDESSPIDDEGLSGEGTEVDHPKQYINMPHLCKNLNELIGLSEYLGKPIAELLTPLQIHVILKALNNQQLGEIFTASARDNSLSVVNLLLSYRKNELLNWQDSPKSWTALMEAASAGHNEIVQALLKQGASATARTKSTGDSALTLAASNNQYDTVRLLLDAGASCDSRNFREVALICAAEKKHRPVIRLLLGRGARIPDNPQNACLIKTERERAHLFAAAKGKNSSELTRLLKAGWPLYAQNEEGTTLYQTIISSGQCRSYPKIIEWLGREAIRKQSRTEISLCGISRQPKRAKSQTHHRAGSLPPISNVSCLGSKCQPSSTIGRTASMPDLMGQRGP